MLGSKEGNRGSVSSMAVLFHEIEIIEEAFRKLYVRAMSEICTIVREKCARLAFVPDRIILEAASDVDCTSCSSLNSLLSFCFMGMESVIVSSIADNERLNAARDTTHPLILPGGASASRTKSQDGDLMRREFVEQRHFVSSVMGVSGGRLLLDPSAESFTRLGPGTSLATLVSGLDGTLRKSFLGATRSCLEACGRMQVDEWVGYFPARCILLVDACAWTQTAASALSRLQQGERTAMRWVALLFKTLLFVLAHHNPLSTLQGPLRPVCPTS